MKFEASRLWRLVALLVLASLTASCGERAAAPRPDVVVVLVDTLRSDRLGCYGYPKDTSPFLDRLAAEGTLFFDVTSQASWTLPSMVSMLQGRYVTAYRDAVVEGAPTLAEVYEDAGYTTIGVVGNLGMGPMGGFARGFRWFDNRQARDAQGQALGRARSVEEVLADLRVHLDHAAQAADPEAPTFLYVHLMDPHAPYDPYPQLDGVVNAVAAAPSMPWDWQASLLGERGGGSDSDWQAIERDRGRYDQGVRHTDDGLAALFAELRGRGLLEHSVVVVASDHGECLWERVAPLDDERGGVDLPLEELFYRGHGALVNREATATPLLFWGSAVPAGARVDAPVENVDLMPTLVELCDLALPSGLHGRSLVPLMAGGADAREAVFAFSHNASSVREVATQLKLILPNPWQTRGDVKPQLFDLSVDPGERVNLLDSPSSLEDVRRMQSRIKDWRARHPTVDTMGTPMDPEQAAALEALGYTEQDIGR